MSLRFPATSTIPVDAESYSTSRLLPVLAFLLQPSGVFAALVEPKHFPHSKRLLFSFLPDPRLRTAAGGFFSDRQGETFSPSLFAKGTWPVFHNLSLLPPLWKLQFPPSAGSRPSRERPFSPHVSPDKPTLSPAGVLLRSEDHTFSFSRVVSE